MIQLSTEEKQQLTAILQKVIDQISDQKVTDMGDKDRQVLQLLSEGKIYKQIAAALGLSIRTVEAKAQDIKNKMGCQTITEAVLKAYKQKIID